MKVGIVDIGSNTARLLVARYDGGRVRPIREERALLALGEEIERHGRISELKLAETAERARDYVRAARSLGCERIEIIVTAPGRQSGNGSALVRSVERATGLPARVLSAHEEGALAFEGALAQTDAVSGRVAVCDVGGGSTEVVAGTGATGPDLVHSLDIGSLRLTCRRLDRDPPGRKAVSKARAEIAEHLEDIDVPTVETAFATGGTARALRRVARARVLGEDQIAAAAKSISKRTASELAHDHGLDPVRARTLLGGTLILAEVQRRLGVPLEVARGGLREGAVVTLASELAAA